MAPGSEALINTYPAESVQALAIDTWDGPESLVAIFADNSGIEYPILMYGAQNGILSDYNCNYDYFFIIGGDGIIKWRGNWDQAAMTLALDSAVADLSTSAVPDVPANGHKLLANYPNPFNPMTRIPFELEDGAGTSVVRLEILDMRGRLIKTLVQGERTNGQRYEAVWNGLNEAGQRVPSGSYLSRLKIGEQVQSRLLTLVK
ncbi:MAG: hypothetical protein ACI9UK_002440 [Candidatus Krumholzibacteriia bacterium]